MTPDERWRTHEQFLRSHGLFTRSGRKAFGFKVAGMSAAILQGAPATTLDTDLWVELPERHAGGFDGLERVIGRENLMQSHKVFSNSRYDKPQRCSSFSLAPGSVTLGR